jgi:meiosis induction protein kinase IME2/SME1
MKKTFDSFAQCMELREVVFLRTLPPHPHLVPALDIFLDPFTKKLHIAMEYMEGNLYQLMKSRDHKCLDNASVKSILYQIMQGLEHIHAHSFFHRDIKPENILVSTSAHSDYSSSFKRYSALVTPPSTPPTYTVKIADFGLARETHSKLPYTTYVSTRWYRAPEVLLRAGEYSAPVDIWAVGAMAVEVATLKPLFPGGNEVDQVWRVCEIMGSPALWTNKNGQPVGGGEWKEGTRLAGKLGFSFPKMAPHSMETFLPSPQWPPSLARFVTWCLMWDPKNRPTSTQALAHEYFADAVDPTRPKSSATKVLGRKQSDVAKSKESVATTQSTSSAKPSWFRKSLIGKSESAEAIPVAPQPPAKDTAVSRPSPVLPPEPPAPAPAPKPRAAAAQKRTTWANGPSNVAPMPILPTIRPISPLSDAVTAQANNRAPSYGDVGLEKGAEEKGSKKIGRQLSVQSSTNHYAELHRKEAERALNGQTGLASPTGGYKESFFSHLRKRARRFSGRHQTPISPTYDDLEAQAGCAPWGSNRSSMAIDSPPPAPLPKDTYDSLDKKVSDQAPAPPTHQASSTSTLKRHHSLPHHHQQRSIDNPAIANAARGTGPVSSRTRRAQAVQGISPYDAPDEEAELLDEVLTSTRRAIRKLEKAEQQAAQTASANTASLVNPYPTPSPSASGNVMPWGDAKEAVTPKPLHFDNKAEYKWPTPPYDEGDWAATASASIWAAGSRF